MKDFRNGVRYYTKATAEIGFPEDDLVCHWCPFLTSDYKLNRERCGKTGEVLIAPLHELGYFCPLKFEERNDDLSESPF